MPALAVVILLAAVVTGLLLVRDDEGGAGTAPPTPVELEGVASFDPPPGDGDEHGERVADATDGDPTSYWTTETYRSFGKPGVGLVLDAGRPRELARVVVTTDTPGFTAEIRAGGSRAGPFERVAAAKAVVARTAWELEAANARYYVVWITRLEGRAHVNEVEAS